MLIKPVKINKFIKRSGYEILFLILIFAYRLFIFSQVKLFLFSDFKAYLNGIEVIARNGSIPLVDVNFLYLISYIGYFFKYILGNISYFYIFNSLLATATSLIIYLLVKDVTNNRKAGLIVFILHIIYTEFIVFSSIFYSEIIIIFILSIVLLSISKSLKVKKSYFFLFLFLILVLVNFSFYLKGTFKYLWIIILIYSLFNLKNRKLFTRLLVLSLLLYGSRYILKKMHVLPHQTKVGGKDFVFFGHTLYGGDGGEGDFIYEENRQRYIENLKKYLNEHNIDDPTMKDYNRFKMLEVRKFRQDHPFRWVQLQLYKISRLFGIVPETNSYRVLLSTTSGGHNLTIAGMLVFPIVVIILGIFFTLNPADLDKLMHNPFTVFLILMAVYFVAATSLYGHYQERYRMPIFVCFLIPLFAYNLTNFRIKDFFKSKKIVVWKTIMILLVIFIWSTQVYHVLVTRRDRYLGPDSVINQTISEEVRY